MVYFADPFDPFDDSRALEELEEEITSLAAQIHAATHRLLTLIAAFDRRQGWKAGGHRSCAHWLSFRTGIDLGASREKVRAAKALVDLPETSASMARGQISFSKVRAITRVATKANEGKLLEVARDCTAAQLEKVVRGVRRGNRRDEAALERERYESRCLSVFPDSEGMYVVRGRLPAEVGALLMRGVEAASDALYRVQGRATGDSDQERDPGRACRSGVRRSRTQRSRIHRSRTFRPQAQRRKRETRQPNRTREQRWTRPDAGTHQRQPSGALQGLALCRTRNLQV